MHKDQTRDLEADLTICEAAVKGPWFRGITPCPDELRRSRYHCCVTTTRSTMVMAITGPEGDKQSKLDADFIAAAREGWPYAIRRALEAEAEVDRLRNELQIYQEQDRGNRGPWD